MSEITNTPSLCIKPLLAKQSYTCGLCDGGNPEGVGFDGFLNGKVFIEGTNSPVCEDCCQKHAPYLHSLCKLEEAVNASWGYNDDSQGNTEALKLIHAAAEEHGKHEHYLLRSQGSSDSARLRRLFDGEDEKAE